MSTAKGGRAWLLLGLKPIAEIHSTQTVYEPFAFASREIEFEERGALRLSKLKDPFIVSVSRNKRHGRYKGLPVAIEVRRDKALNYFITGKTFG